VFLAGSSIVAGLLLSKEIVMPSQILIVNPDREVAESLRPSLTSRGFDVVLAADFDEAAGALRRHAFHAIVAAHRLGSYNGLHLVLRARLARPGVVAVITSTIPDPQLDAEAGAFGAVCLVAPWQDASRLLEVLRSEGTLPARV
jgi:ActR/RegA family two-component response regulator